MVKELIKKVIAGDKSSFQELYEKYIDSALRVATATTKNQELAKDAVQETFIRVYKNLSSYNVEKNFEPWFYRILLNECNRLLAKESKVLTLTQPFDELEFKITEDHDQEEFTYLYEAVQSLKDIYRIPIILKYLEGFSEKEIAEILDLNQNTVKSRLFKGRDALKRLLEENSKGGTLYGN